MLLLQGKPSLLMWKAFLTAKPPLEAKLFENAQISSIKGSLLPLTTHYCPPTHLLHICCWFNEYFCHYVQWKGDERTVLYVFSSNLKLFSRKTNSSQNRPVPMPAAGKRWILMDIFLKSCLRTYQKITCEPNISWLEAACRSKRPPHIRLKFYLRIFCLEQR